MKLNHPPKSTFLIAIEYFFKILYVFELVINWSFGIHLGATRTSWFPAFRRLWHFFWYVYTWLMSCLHSELKICFLKICLWGEVIFMLSLTGWCVCLSVCLCVLLLSISAVVVRLWPKGQTWTTPGFFLTFILYWTTVALQCCVSFRCVCVCVLVAQSCPTLWDPMNCSSPGFSVHGAL